MGQGKLRLGTSSWTAKGWEETFYPAGMKSSDYIGHYATRYNTVEIDATFYAVPSVAAVANWAKKTPDGFLFAAKVPQTITHEKLLHDCQGEMAGFLKAIRGLGDRRKIETLKQAKSRELVWNERVIDRSNRLERWAPHIKSLLDRPVDVCSAT